MQISSIVTLALLPLLALADGEPSTTTSTTTLYKTITIQRAVSTASITANTTSSFYLPTGTGSVSLVAASTTKSSSGSTGTSTGATVIPTIDNSNGAMSLGAANVAAAGLVGLIVAAFM